MQKKHVDAHLNFPWLALLWIISSLPLSYQYNNVICKDRLGHWFKGWCAYWVARHDLDSRAARADLEATLILLQEDMAEIESIHAAIRRELVVLSTQVTTLDFLELSDRHVLRCARRHPGTYGVTAHTKVGLRRAKAAMPESDSSAGEPDAKRSKHGPRTGGYRHWLSERTQNDPKGCAQKGLGVEYDKLPPEERDRHVRAAADAAEAIKCGGRGYALSKQMLTAEARRTNTADQIAVFRRSGEMDPCESSASRALGSLSLSAGTDFDDGIRTIKAGLRSTTVADGVASELQAQAIDEHAERQRNKDGAYNGLPKDIADVLGTDWHLLPHEFPGQLRHMRGSFPMVAKVVGTFIQAKQTKAIPREFASKLFPMREEMHNPAMHDKAPRVHKQEAASNDLPCNVAGFCVHGTDGVLITVMHHALLRAIMVTKLPAANKVDRKSLGESRLVMYVSAVRVDVVHGPSDAFGVAPLPVQVLLSEWIHLGHVDLIPRGFVGQRLDRYDGGSLWPGDGPAEIALQMRWDFLNAWRFVRYLDKTLIWTLRVFEFCQSPRILGEMDISRCTVSELAPWPRDANRAVVFWDGCRSIQKARRSDHHARVKAVIAAGNVLEPVEGFVCISFLFLYGRLSWFSPKTLRRKFTLDMIFVDVLFCVF